MTLEKGPKAKKSVIEEIRNNFKEPKHPDDFNSKEEFLEFAINKIEEDLVADKNNRDQAIEDAKFTVGEQWDDAIQQQRAADKKPTLVFNRLPAFVAQIVGNRRLNETDIKVLPDSDAYRKTAKIREGLIRFIQKSSRAKIAFNKAFENEVITGMGNFKVVLEYTHDDVFEQDIKIKAIDNALAVVWDKSSSEPTGQDARHVSEVEAMSPEDFKADWPNGTAGDIGMDVKGLGYEIPNGWVMEDQVRVVHFWRMRSKKRLVALVNDEKGDTEIEDVTDKEVSEYMDRLVIDESGMPKMREVDRRYAQLYIITATDILEGPYDLPISRVPIFRVPAWDINVGETRHRFGLIRFLKDPQRLHNYWRSIIAEKLMMTPKVVWVASKEAITGYEEKWANSHLTNESVLVYNEEARDVPQRNLPAQIEAGLIEQAGMAAQDLKDISNLHEANLGQTSNEVSGKAILARQRVGETGTVIYQDNMDLAQEECGRVINELIPFAYDTVRTIKILGADGKDIPAVTINSVVKEDGIDITAGKYTITSTTGPSYVTKRVEASDSMLNMVNAMPQIMSVAADKIVEAQDWPGAEAIASRLRKSLPANLVDQSDLSEEELKAQVAAQEQAQKASEREELIFQAELREKNAKAEQAEALADKARADARESLSDADKNYADIENETKKTNAVVEESKANTVLKATETFSKVTREQ